MKARKESGADAPVKKEKKKWPIAVVGAALAGIAAAVGVIPERVVQPLAALLAALGL